jgi:GT2 family glycosyltransferase
MTRLGFDSRPQRPGVTGVLPTYNRASSIAVRMPQLLAIEGLTEIVVVNDGSQDETLAILQSYVDHPRVRILSHAINRGVPAARNTGADEATTEWVLMLEDDVDFPPDYATTLLAVASRTGADIVGAPWIHAPADQLPARIAKALEHRVESLTLRSHPSLHPRTDLVTPFLPALALIRRSVFRKVKYPTAYRGNAYREETSFYVSAMRSGMKVVLTPTTRTTQTDIVAGGAKMPPLAYEFSAIRNNGRFLAEHGRWLHEQGLGKSPAMEQAAFMWTRSMRLLRMAGSRVRSKSRGSGEG